MKQVSFYNDLMYKNNNTLKCTGMFKFLDSITFQTLDNIPPLQTAFCSPRHQH